MESNRDWLDWVWGYERLGDWFFMRVFLALVFLIIAAVVLHFVFHSYYKIVEGKTAVSFIKGIVGLFTG